MEYSKLLQRLNSMLQSNNIRIDIQELITELIVEHNTIKTQSAEQQLKRVKSILMDIDE